MTPPESMEQMIASIPSMTVAAAHHRLTTLGATIKTTPAGKWSIGGAPLSDEDLVRRARLKIARILRGLDP